MKQIGILTFHGAHNYGSMLQNYALQRALVKIDPDFHPITINLRNDAQDDMYNAFKKFSDFNDKRRYFFNLLLRPWKSSLVKKRDLFEGFLINNINLSTRISSGEEIKNLPKMDAFIVGSDQIWNFKAKDYDKAYFLDFAADDSKTLKLAYAPSMGTVPNIACLSETDKKEYKDLINKFDAISTREVKTSESIANLGKLESIPKVCPDPTLLLESKDWLRLIADKAPIVKGKYIFLYNPYYLKDVYDQAKALSKITGLPVVVSNLSQKSIIPALSFKKYLASGPVEFLNLVSNAEYIIGRSFHLAVFSMLFHKRMIAVNGSGDSRLAHFLKSISMEMCMSDGNNIPEVLPRIENLDFNDCDRKIEVLREEGYSFLRDALSSMISQ